MLENSCPLEDRWSYDFYLPSMLSSTLPLLETAPGREGGHVTKEGLLRSSWG